MQRNQHNDNKNPRNGGGRNIRSEDNWRDKKEDIGNISEEGRRPINYTNHPRRNIDNDNEERRRDNQIYHPSRRNQNFNENRNFGGPPKIGFRKIQELLNNNNLEEVVFCLTNERKGIRALMENDNLGPDLIVLSVKLLARVCGCSFGATKTHLLQTVIDSGFARVLTQFISSLPIQSDREKKFNAFFWNDAENFCLNVVCLVKTLNNLIPMSSCEANLKLLKALTFTMTNLQGVHISDKIKNEFKDLSDIVEKVWNDIQTKKENTGTDEDTYIEPPDNFRDIGVYPNTHEITSQQHVFLRPNVIKGPYRDIEHYLDVQYRLYREDFVQPLRNGICKYLEDPKTKLENIRTYRNVQFLNRETISDQNCYRLQYDFSNEKKSFEFENSKRFMYGSLLCFTRDNFRTILFGTVAGRDLDTLSKGQLIVGFRNNAIVPQTIIGPQFLMLESKVFFEPYYQVLNALKNMSTIHFPMERYIILVESEAKPPEYLKTPLELLPKGQWPEISETPSQVLPSEQRTVIPLEYNENIVDGLNAGQREAFEAALTKEFVIIQGPPGTGKTFLGLKIARTLLENMKRWYRKTPMLVICYTNHALDQFLEGLLPVTDELIRIGSQSKNKNIEQFNIRNHRSQFRNHTLQEKRREVANYLSHIDSIKHNLNEIDRYTRIVDFSVFANIFNFRGTWFERATSDNILNWLFEEGHNAMPNRMEGPVEGYQENEEVTTNEENRRLEIENEENLDTRFEEIEDIFKNIEINPFKELIGLKSLRDRRSELLKEYDYLQKNEIISPREKYFQEDRMQMELYMIENYLDVLIFRLLQGQKNKNKSIQPEFIDMRNPYNMPYDLRWQCYFYWLELYKKSLHHDREVLIRDFQRIYGVYKEMQEMEDTQTMKEALVIGMTTTCAARHQSSLQALKIPIVIVEEAAEILESHIIVALTPHCEHLILIGDHQQLKPSTANYKIETKFKLGVSLFERMILNNIQCHTLNIQHRMRPEIANLIRPAIYPVLEDGDSVQERDHVKGIEHNLFFIDHNEEEQVCKDNSKKNVHEATFLMQLAKHLILNGYKPDQIVVLAAYLGQMFELQRHRRNYSHILKDVRIAVLDNYQGEESDIVLLSLVRNNHENSIGFLKLENRVCVALSRAKNGLYIMGNMNLLCSNSEIWPKIQETLRQQQAIGTHLTLRCVIHRHKVTRVSTADDFAKLPEGGCDLLCETPLNCGHVCTRLCHIEDREHANYDCREPCEKILCDDQTHVCSKLCYERCGRCSYVVKRQLPCDHTVNIACHLDPTTYKCTITVETTLPCDHITMIPCSADKETFNCPFPCDTRVEPCGHSCEKKCHFISDPDHLNYSCRKQCDKSCKGCTAEEPHICPKFCYEECGNCLAPVRKTRSCGHMFDMGCSINPEDIECKKRCKKILDCGHKCKETCGDPCEPCKEQVEKIVPDCNHKIKMNCFEPPNRKLCKGKCPRLLPCGHVCDKKCNEDCTQECKEIVDCCITSPCGHIITKIACHLKTDHDDKILVENCTEPCNAQLTCKHKCSGSCSQCYHGRFHQRCQEKCGVILVCNHECPIPCREACKPCRKPCEYRCVHSKCKKLCGDPCTPCKEICQRKCEHQRCKKRCGELCSVEPCTLPCPKRIKKCGHSCVGFCGDPCPKLCRLCDADELTEIFFGTEDDEDARFVLLLDCGHVMESTGMMNWLDQNRGNVDEDQKIQPLVCPKCKTVIKKSARYSDYVKKSMKDLKDVKMKFYGKPKEIEIIKYRIQEKLSKMYEGNRETTTISSLRASRLNIKTRKTIGIGNSAFVKIKTTLTDRLLSSKDNRRQNIDKMDLDAIRMKVELMQLVMEPLEKEKLCLLDLTLSNNHVSLIMEFLGKHIDSITEQEVIDIGLEINRLHRFIQFERLGYKPYLQQPGVQAKVDATILLLNKHGRYDDDQDKIIKNSLEELKVLTSSKIALTDAEKFEIVKAVGLTTGHWYKCPNGHPYAIGECGGANQESSCYECGAPIGGRSHRLAPGNDVATDMDGATYPAWSEQANMANYQL
ncbi:unnamed protein product [Psylliodes chrysocephalus]|uniref:RZ-type domain-containing protein n=1 Tax=Psylliodes chrysocephalus TaxID=3402493 RepID=A0A9P0CQ42_9CUCU|nr:unnamed protein product [Psylliodes chrysocephala]